EGLGAALPCEMHEDVKERKEAVAAAKPQAAELPNRPRETPPAPLPKKSATKTNWNSLVTDLGLPPLEEPDPIAAAPSAKPEIPRSISRPEAPREREPEQARGRRPERPDPDNSDRERPPRREQREQSGQRRERSEEGRERPSRGREDTDQGREQTRRHRERSDLDGEQTEPRRESSEQSREQS